MPDLGHVYSKYEESRRNCTDQKHGPCIVLVAKPERIRHTIVDEAFGCWSDY